MMSRMLNRFRSEGGDSGIVVRENEEKLKLIGGRWRVVGSSFENDGGLVEVCLLSVFFFFSLLRESDLPPNTDTR